MFKDKIERPIRIALRHTNAEQVVRFALAVAKAEAKSRRRRFIDGGSFGLKPRQAGHIARLVRREVKAGRSTQEITEDIAELAISIRAAKSRKLRRRIEKIDALTERGLLSAYVLGQIQAGKISLDGLVV